MEELLAKHRKQQRDLQSQITQKKKSASKKTRKSVNDECDRLEQDLKTEQSREIAALESNGVVNEAPEIRNTVSASDEPSEQDDLLAAIAGDAGPKGSGTSDTEPNSADSGNVAPSKKPNRQKARLARRAAEQEAVKAQAAEEAANMPDLKQRERNKMIEESGKRHLVEKEVAANGHCLYLAMADQMSQLKLDVDPLLNPANGETKAAPAGTQDYKRVRSAAADYIAKHPDDFVPFLEEPLDDYLHKIRDTGEWGGQLELMALAKTYGVDINVLQGDGRVEKIESGQPGEKREAWLAYYRHGFGLGEHYNSLRQTPKQVAG